MNLLPSKAIADLNDHFRKAGPLLHSLSRWVVTQGVSVEGIDFTLAAIEAVKAFDTFTEDNDPYGEHDFGTIEVKQAKLFWKIDYYDPTMQFGSEDPANPFMTIRVMAIMLASEY